MFPNTSNGNNDPYGPKEEQNPFSQRWTRFIHLSGGSDLKVKDVRGVKWEFEKDLSK